MRIRLTVALLALILFAPARQALAQGYALGTFQSFKGVGLSAEVLSSSGREFSLFTLYADLAKVYTGANRLPGIKMGYSRNIRIADFEPKTLDDLCLFAGSGFTAGWVMDSGREVYGACGALSGTFGARAAFPCGVVFSLGLTLETGLLLYPEGGNVKSTLYRDGIYNAVLPHLTISYFFK
ncbi:MAG: hypothetical protein K6F58_04520 [Bacteroidales bacterium]|nr:hypothetical protein [Bacteroidales bacterium]